MPTNPTGVLAHNSPNPIQKLQYQPGLRLSFIPIELLPKIITSRDWYPWTIIPRWAWTDEKMSSMSLEYYLSGLKHWKPSIAIVIVLVWNDQSDLLLNRPLYRSPVNKFKRLLMASSMPPDPITGTTMSDQPTTVGLLSETFWPNDYCFWTRKSQRRGPQEFESIQFLWIFRLLQPPFLVKSNLKPVSRTNPQVLFMNIQELTICFQKDEVVTINFRYRLYHML
jgi:hypothetical protein